MKSDDVSLVLLGAGALLGIAVAGVGLFTAKGTATHHVPPEDAALVNQRPILMSDFVAQVEGTYAEPYARSTAEQRKAVLDAMIHEELYVQRGLELDFPGTDPDTRAALVAAVEQQAVADATTELPSEQALEAYYAEHRSEYATEGTLLVRDFLLDAGPGNALPDGAGVAAALRAGATPEQLALRFRARELRPSRGEDFYFAAKIQLGDRLFEIAKALPDGAVSEPVTLADGVHVLRMAKNSPPVPRGFADAREQVLGDYKRAVSARLRAADEKYLYGKADIQIAASLQ
jgi:hypothetical protein